MIAESQKDGAEDRPPTRRLARIAVWIGDVAALIWILDLLGIPVREWIDELFDKLGFLSEHTGLIIGILIGGLVLIGLLGGTFRRRLAGLRSQVAGGGAVTRTPRRFIARVVAPSPGSYLARLEGHRSSCVPAPFAGSRPMPFVACTPIRLQATNGRSGCPKKTGRTVTFHGLSSRTYDLPDDPDGFGTESTPS